MSIHLRLPASEVAKLDAWIAANPVTMTRPAAIRSLVDQVLTSEEQ